MYSDQKMILQDLKNQFGAHNNGNIVVASKEGTSGMRHTVFPVNAIQDAAAHMAEQSKGSAMYVAFCLHDDVALSKHTRTSRTAMAVPYICLDIDASFGRHKAENLPSTLEQVYHLIESAGIPAPTEMICSGGGYYARWYFDELFLIRDETDRKKISDVLRAFHKKANVAWAAAGLTLDATYDLARVYRVPGTINWKDPEHPKLVTVCQPDNGSRWTVQEMESLVAAELQLDSSAGGAGTKLVRLLDGNPSSLGGKTTGGEAAGLDSMLAGCRFVQHCVENSAGLPEPLWKDLADLLAHVPQGAKIFHSLSSNDPRYDFAETQSKLERAKQFKPKLCRTIAANFEGCSGCVFGQAEVFGTPLKLRHTSADLVSLQTQFALDAHTGHFYEFATREMKPEAWFDRIQAQKLKDRSRASLQFRQSSTSIVVDAVRYLPGRGRYLWSATRNHPVLNTWNDSGIAAAEGDCSIWLEHLEYLVPEPAVRAWLICALALLVQRPAEKISAGFMLTSRQGVGKNSLAKAMKAILGDENVTEQYGNILETRWTAPLGNVQLCVLDEVSSSEHLSVYNTMKRWVTEPYVDVERKGVDQFPVRTPSLILLFSNHDIPLRIEEGDRRFCVSVMMDAPKSDEYYRRLHEVGMAPATLSAFKHYLSQVDLAGFNPHAAPPVTEAKRNLVAQSVAHWKQLVTQWREDGQYPFDRDLYTADEVVNAINGASREKLTVQRIASYLTSLGDRKLERKVKLPTSTSGVNIWAFRNADTWDQASPDEIRRELNRKPYYTAVHALPGLSLAPSVS